MKKLVGVVLGLVASLPICVLAEEEVAPKLSWGAWGRAIFAPAVSNQGGEVVPRDAASWGWNSRIGFTLRGESKNVGFHVDMKADTGELADLQDQQKIWVRPIDSVTIEFGPNVFYDTLRGNGAYGSWDWLRFNGIGGEDSIFARGQAGGGDGTHTPNAAAGSIVHFDSNGWHAFAALNVIEDGSEIKKGEEIRDIDADGNADKEAYTTALMLTRGQYGVGKEIEGLGMARLQYIGKSYVKDITKDELESYAIINAAFKLDKAIENVYLDFGVFTPTDSDNTNGDKTTIAAYGNYKLGTITPHLLVEAILDKADADGKEGTALKVGAGADFDLGNGYGLNTDLRFHNETAVAVKDVDNQTAFLVGLKKGFSNGVIGIGLEGTTQDFGGGVVGKEKADDFGWAIPIRLEYWF